jgi:hypothetical protein
MYLTHIIYDYAYIKISIQLSNILLSSPHSSSLTLLYIHNLGSVWLEGKKVKGKKITQINEWIWTNISLSSFIDMRNFLSSHFLSFEPNEGLSLNKIQYRLTFVFRMENLNQLEPITLPFPNSNHKLFFACDSNNRWHDSTNQ